MYPYIIDATNTSTGKYIRAYSTDMAQAIALTQSLIRDGYDRTELRGDNLETGKFEVIPVAA